MKQNPSLLKTLIEGGKPPEVDIVVEISAGSIIKLMLAALITAFFIMHIKKHIF